MKNKVIQLLESIDNQYNPPIFYISEDDFNLFEESFPDDVRHNWEKVGYDTAFNPYLGYVDLCLPYRAKPVFMK